MIQETLSSTTLTPQEQRARLLQLLAKKEAGTRLAPLSFSQERFWLQEQLAPGSINSLSMTARIRGRLSVSILEQCFTEIVRRHESLRTSVVVLSGQPMQSIKAAQPFQLPVISLEHFPAVDRETEARRASTAELSRPFDIVHGPLFRATLLRLNSMDHVLILITQHLISDAWSLSVLIQELSVLYEAFATGQPSPLPPLPFQYADFARWQREKMQGEVLDRELAYWIRQVGDSAAALAIPTDRPRLPTKSSGGAREPTTIPLALREQLKTLAQQEGGTLFMVLLAGLQTLLYRYTGQNDISIYTLVANRTANTVEKLIGLFLNTLLLRIDLSRNPTFIELLHQARQITLEAYDHQTIPFQKLMEALQARRDLKRTPLFQVLLLLQNVPYPTIQLSDLACERFVREMDFQADMELSLSLVETDAGLSGWIEYQTDLYDATTIRRLLMHYQTLLTSIVQHPHQRIAELPMLTEPERHQILVEWNATRLDYPSGRCIHELFEDRVRHTPDAIAVVFGAQHLSYQELNRRANQLAHYLQARQVGPEMFVGIYLERSIDVIVAVLAIVKAGGAYLPLDPQYPRERLAFMLEDAHARILLTHRQLLPDLEGLDVPIICLDQAAADIAAERPEKPHSTVMAENVVYAIYTSGSTGKPKGVMITHANLVNAYLAWEKDYALLTTITCHLQMANFTFDVFAGDWVRALCSGAKLVLCPREYLLDPESLYNLLRRENVEAGEFVPVVVRSLLHHLQQTGQSLDFLRMMVVGSDSWYLQEYRQAASFCGLSTRLINSYGATECTIDSSYFENSDNPSLSTELTPIGRPFANTQLYVLDRYLHPTPVGVPGELYIGGLGLARGYLNHPELTAARFIPDPFNTQSGQRLYKTGDQACYLPDGNLDFLGRLDNQVKIRGFRIELGEVEAALGEHPAVHQAVVVCVTHDNMPGNNQLVACLVPSPATAPTAGDLRDFLKKKLPDYAVPSAFLILDKFPLTASGKVDRPALLILAKSRPQSEEARIAPRTALEQTLAGIWSQVMNLENIGIYDNFFDLGGHSIMATQIVYRINHTFQLDLPMRSLFDEPTVAGLGLLIEEKLLDEFAPLPSEAK